MVPHKREILKVQVYLYFTSIMLGGKYFVYFKTVNKRQQVYKFKFPLIKKQFYMIFIRDLAIEVFNISAMTLKKVEDIKGVNRSGKSKDRQYNCQKRTIGQATIYKTLHRKQ